MASFSEGDPVRSGEKSMRGMKESEEVVVGEGFGGVAEGAMLLVAWSITRFRCNNVVVEPDFSRMKL